MPPEQMPPAQPRDVRAGPQPYSKPEVNYRPGEPGKACRDCRHFDGSAGCDLVQGQIAPGGVCDMWEGGASGLDGLMRGGGQMPMMPMGGMQG